MNASQLLAEALCIHCGALIYTTDWDDVYGVFVPRMRVDPTPLDQQAILACVLTGRVMFTACRCAGGWVLGDRSAATLAWQGSPDGALVLPQHVCGARFDSSMPRGPTTAPVPVQCPF